MGSTMLISQSVLQQIMDGQRSLILQQTAMLEAMVDVTEQDIKSCVEMILEDGSDLQQALTLMYKLNLKAYEEVRQTLEDKCLSVKLKDRVEERIRTLLLDL